jgi:hypothetical protein
VLHRTADGRWTSRCSHRTRIGRARLAVQRWTADGRNAGRVDRPDAEQVPRGSPCDTNPGKGRGHRRVLTDPRWSVARRRRSLRSETPPGSSRSPDRDARRFGFARAGPSTRRTDASATGSRPGRGTDRGCTSAAPARGVVSGPRPGAGAVIRRRGDTACPSRRTARRRFERSIARQTSPRALQRTHELRGGLSTLSSSLRAAGGILGPPRRSRRTAGTGDANPMGVSD